MMDGDMYSNREAGTSITTSGRLALSSVHAGSKLVGNYNDIVRESPLIREP